MSCVRVAVSIALTLMATTLTATARPPVAEPTRDAPAQPSQTATPGSEQQDEGKPEPSPVIVAHCDVWDGGAARAHAANAGMVPTIATLDRTPFTDVAPVLQHISGSSEPEPVAGARRCRRICRHPNAPPRF